MRIARVLTRLNLGGPARQVLASDPLLVRAGHAVRVFCGAAEKGEGDLADELAARGIEVERVSGLARGLNPAKDLWALSALRSKLAAFRPQIVHTHASKAGALGRRAAAALGGARTVHTFHGHVLEGYFPDIVSRRLIAQERRLAARTDRVIAVAHATADDLVRLGVVDPAKLVVVPPGIEIEPFLALARPAPGTSEWSAARRGPLRALLGADPARALVGVIGRLAEVKQPLRALEVLKLLAAKHARLELVYVGDGELYAPLVRAVRALEPELARRVHVLGARADMPELLAELDAVLLCSRSEGAPVCLIEAHAAALPAVAMDVGGVGELVAHERTGFLAKSVDELAFGLDKLLESDAFAHGCGLRGRLRVRERHSGAALAARLDGLYHEVWEAAPCAS
ncbi:MAG: glycosyltransferase family 1 protein [Planctomycetota bacterium]|nr:MAG: glycosyltransferase family 1 protein [Planctomycetota bacterium]